MSSLPARDVMGIAASATSRGVARHAPPGTASVRASPNTTPRRERSKDSAGEPTRFQMLVRPGNPDFLDLPWREPLERVAVASGSSRSRAASTATSCASSATASALYALKALPPRIARQEYRLLRELDDAVVPVVDAVGVVTRTPEADGHEPEAVLITRHLDFSLPYRSLFSGPGVPDLRNSLLDALAELLVRIHLAGFFWGDCSLSNTLFRRDAGTLSAYLVDAETGELHPSLSDGQRAHDLQIAEENVAGELLDLEAAEAGLPSGLDPIETAAEVPRRYESLWSELTREDVFGPDETYRIDERLRRLNGLGFDVEEVRLVGDAGGRSLRLNPQVVEPGHHRRRLHTLTGLTCRRTRRGACSTTSRPTARPAAARGTPESVVAYRWLTEVLPAGDRGHAGRAARQARARRAVPRDPRAPLVPLGGGAARRRPAGRGGLLRRERPPPPPRREGGAGTRRTKPTCSNRGNSGSDPGIPGLTPSSRTWHRGPARDARHEASAVAGRRLTRAAARTPRRRIPVWHRLCRS